VVLSHGTGVRIPVPVPTCHMKIAALLLAGLVLLAEAIPLHSFTETSHASMTRRAAGAGGPAATPRDVEYLVYYNLLQDVNAAYVNDANRHVDRSQFVESIRRLDREWQAIESTKDRLTALRAFGRILHTVGDFYAHSNWVELRQGRAPIPTFSFDAGQLPSGLISGWWPDDASEVTLRGRASHQMLNKDTAQSESGRRIVRSGPNKGRSLFELAYGAALRSCEEQCARFRKILAEGGPRTTKAYLFDDSRYYAVDVFTGEIDPGYPRPIAGNWKGVTFTSIDAAANWGNGKVYFFKDGEYIRYDVQANRADPGYPKRISTNWPGMTFSRIDTVFVNERNDRAYFFRGGQYIRYDIHADAADPGYPKSIRAEWKGLVLNDWDSALNWEDGFVDFFKGSERYRYDLAADRIAPGGPASMSRRRGWPPKVDAALIWR
jgi:hypothetical protein